MTPVGTPVETIIPSRTEKVFGAQLTFTHPARSAPLNNGTSCPSSAQARLGAKTPKAQTALNIRRQSITARILGLRNKRIGSHQLLSAMAAEKQLTPELSIRAPTANDCCQHFRTLR
jgi:hypothetical protein